MEMHRGVLQEEETGDIAIVTAQELLLLLTV